MLPLDLELSMDLKELLSKEFHGEILDDEASLRRASRDASLLEVRPQLVAVPRNVEELKELVQFAGYRKKDFPNLSLTARAGGTDMTGGPLNESIIVDFTKYFSSRSPAPKMKVLGSPRSARPDFHFRSGVAPAIKVDVKRHEATVLPGAYYRDFEAETLKYGLIMPSYPASREICTVGGMVANNAGGEKTLRWGKTENFVRKLKAVFSDGKEYEILPLDRRGLEVKMAQKDFEGQIYRELYKLITTNYKLLAEAKPKVSKNSAGYYLWNVWDGKTFDLNKLIVGSQGTLALVTEITFGLVAVKPISKLLVVFLKDLKPLAQIVSAILPFKPESLESYDDNTLKLAMRFFADLLRVMKIGFISLAWNFLPEFGLILSGGMPRLVVLAEVTGDSEEEVDRILAKMKRAVDKFGVRTRITRNERDTKKYWTIRRESFNLLRKHVHGKRTAPFIDDIIVRPEHLPEFLPRLQKILDKYAIYYTLAGHAGDGNFHVIPLMDMHLERNRKIIPVVSEEVYNLVLEYHGSFTAEHNDGLIRTPYLEKMYGSEITRLFSETKKIFDPQGIFNPGKKVGATFKYEYSHLAKD